MKKGLFSLLPLLLVSCYTLTTKIEMESPKEIYFKKGQEYSSRGQYKEAISTYELFIERFPDDVPYVYTARYEIGYTYYKSRKYPEAVKELTPLLSVPFNAPAWIPVLSARTLESIEEKTTPKKKEKKEPKSEKQKEPKKEEWGNDLSPIEESVDVFPSEEEDPFDEDGIGRFILEEE